MIRLENLGISKKRLDEWEIRIETALRLDENFVTGVTRRFYEEYRAKTIEEAVEKLANTTLPVHYRVFVKRVIPPFQVDVDQPLWRTRGNFQAIPRGKIGHRFPWVSAPDTTIFEIRRELYRPRTDLFRTGKHLRGIFLRVGGETLEQAIGNYRSIARDLRGLVRDIRSRW